MGVYFDLYSIQVEQDLARTGRGLPRPRQYKGRVGSSQSKQGSTKTQTVYRQSRIQLEQVGVYLDLDNILVEQDLARAGSVLPRPSHYTGRVGSILQVGVYLNLECIQLEQDLQYRKGSTQNQTVYRQSRMCSAGRGLQRPRQYISRAGFNQSR